MRSQKGAITLITLATVIFILGFLLSSYMIISNRLQAQVAIKKQTAELYEKEVENVDEVYLDYFADKEASIPIRTAEQLLNIGTDERYIIEEKIYEFNSKKNYELKNDIEINVKEYEEKFSELFTTTNGSTIKTWVGIEKLKQLKKLEGNFVGGNHKIIVINGDQKIIYDENNNFSNL